jgi:hypothetical protein
MVIAEVAVITLQALLIRGEEVVVQQLVVQV